MTFDPSAGYRSPRLPSARPEDEDALRRLAMRLGEDPDAAERAAELGAAEQGVSGRSVAAASAASATEAERLARDPEARLAAAIGKCEGLIEGRALARRLAAMAETVESAEEAEALQEAARAARCAAGRDGCPHRAAGFAAGLGGAPDSAEERTRALIAADRRNRLLAALREVLADDIDAARAEGAEAEAAAGLLLERRDLLDDLPIFPTDLAEIGRSIAAEAAADPALAQALERAARTLEASPAPASEPGGE